MSDFDASASRKGKCTQPECGRAAELSD